MSGSHILPSGGLKKVDELFHVNNQIGGKKMKKEPMGNYMEVKKGSYAKFQKQMKNVPDKAFIGKSVKYPFEVISHQTGKPAIEWMWVDVKGVKSPGKLKGKLDNIPWGKTKLKLGSTVILDKNLIAIVVFPAIVAEVIAMMLQKGVSSDQINDIITRSLYPLLTKKFIKNNKY